MSDTYKINIIFNDNRDINDIFIKLINKRIKELLRR